VKKVNFGAGNISPNGWICLDNSPSVILAKLPYFMEVKKIMYKAGIISKNILKTRWPRNLVYWDLRWGVPFKNNSVDIIFTSHFLEHLPKNDSYKFLKKCYKILKNRGVIRIVVPDINILLERYRGDYETDPSFAAEEFNQRIFEGGQHKYMYNFDLLYKILTEIGFKNTKKMDYRKSKIVDIDKLETPKLKYYTSLYIEANK